MSSEAHTASGGSEVVDGLAAYGRIRATIGKWIAYIFGTLMIVGGIVLIAMAAAGKLGSASGCTARGKCCNPADPSCQGCEQCSQPTSCTYGQTSSKCASCKVCDDLSLSRGAYYGIGAGMIVVAVIGMLISTLMARLAYESKGFAAVTGGVGAISDIANVAGMAARGEVGMPMTGLL